MNSGGTVRNVGDSTGADTFDSLILDGATGKVQFALDTDRFPEKPEPTGGGRTVAPGAVVNVQLANATTGKVESLAARGVLEPSAMLHGMTETFVLDTELFDVGQARWEPAVPS